MTYPYANQFAPAGPEPAGGFGPADFRVPWTDDLRRVASLPTRTWTDEQRAQLAVWLTDQLRTGAVCDKCGQARHHVPWSTGPGCWYLDPEHPERAKITPPLSLRPIQAVVLWELYTGARDRRTGVYMQIPVGGGKTLTFFLGAYMVSAKIPLLLVPANLRKDTLDLFELYSRYWKRPHPVPHVESYNILTQQGSVDLLDARAPDYLGADECDKARDLGRSIAKRIGRYVDKVRGQCIVHFGSGSNKRKSLRDDNHFMVWALREHAPAFLTDETLSDCCLALDEESKVGAGRLHPGALLELADMMGVPEHDAGRSIGMLARAREGYARRVRNTPGIVIWDVPECTQPLTIDFTIAPEDPALESAFHWFRTTNKTPEFAPRPGFEGLEGVLLPDALSRYRHAQEIGKGFWYYWDPRPPLDWREARKAWHSEVAWAVHSTRNCPTKCGHGRNGGGCHNKPLDTEMAVANARPDSQNLADWRYAQKLPRENGKPFEPNSVPGWLSDSVVQAVARFAHENWIAHGETGVVWVKEQAFAQRLAQSTGWPYYGEKGQRIDAYGRSSSDDTIASCVTRAAQAGQRPPIVILSIDSNYRGRNLQAYANNLIVGWEQAGTRIEQLLGRTHRSGQTRPVRLTVLVTCGEVLDSFQKTLSEARFVRTQGLTQKILTATIDRSALRAYPAGHRWTRSE